MSNARCGAFAVGLAALVSLASTAAAKGAPLLIDPHQSSARFVVHLLRMRAEGVMGGVTGQLRGSAASNWQVLVLGDGRTLHLDGPGWMERVTRSEAFLAVDKYPAIRFESEVFPDRRLHGGGPLHGRLTLRGVTRPVSFTLLPSGCAHPGRDCDIQVHGTISRQAFGMTSHQVMLRDPVDLRIHVRLQAPTAAQ